MQRQFANTTHRRDCAKDLTRRDLKSKSDWTSAWFALITCLIAGNMIYTAEAADTTPTISVPPLTSQATDPSSKVQSAVKRLFGPSVEAAADRNPYYLTADFNGDRQEDVMVLVRLKGTTGTLPKEVVVLNPWGYDSKNPGASSPLGLAIVHGSREGWDTQTPLERFLLSDKSYFSTPIWESTSQGAPLSIRKRRFGSGRRVAPPKMAKGDAVALGTEAGIDILLYWDGKTYKIYEPQEEP
jgi:hypothetical protein